MLVIVFFAGQTWAQTTEYLQQKDFKTEKKKIYEGINSSKKQLNEIKKENVKTMLSVDSLNKALRNYARQLTIAGDSLSTTSLKLIALQVKVDNEGFLSKGYRILMIVLLHLSVIILFVLTFLFRKKADLNHQSLVELDKKTNEKLELDVKSLKSEIQSCRDLTGNISIEMNQKLSAGLNSFEMKSNQMDQQFQENLTRIEGKIGQIGTEINKLREEQIYSAKALEDKLIALKREEEQNNRNLVTQIAKLEEEFRVLKGKH